MPTVDITLQPNVVESSVETSVVEFTDTSVTVEVPNAYPVVEFVSSVAGSIIAGEGLTGGGNFTGNVPIALSAASISSLNKAETALQPGGLLSALVDDVGYATDAEVQALLDGTGGIYQPINANLTAISGITTTVFGRSFLTLANDVAARTLLGVYSTSQVYTKAEVDAAIAGVEGGVWGQITGSLSAQADLMSAFNTKANLTHSHVMADITDLNFTVDHGGLTGLADDDHPQYHTDARGDARYSLLGHTHAYANAVHTHLWADITDKPLTFAPSSHTHLWADITDKPLTFAPSSHTHLWADITDKPTTFTPAAHVHVASDVTSGVFSTALLGTGTANSGTFLRGDGTWAGIPGGVTDHGALTGLGDDDHTQYHTDARGDARYSLLGHTHAIADVTGLQTALDGKAPLTNPTFVGTAYGPIFTAQNPNNTGATISLGWLSDSPRLRIGGSGAGAAGVFSIQGTSDFVRLSLDASGNLSVPGTIAGVGSGLTSLNASNVSTGTLSDSRLSSNVALKNAIQTFTEQQTFRWAKQELHGLTRNNLGDPSLPEMALFETQFDNKLWFYPHANITCERSEDGTTWIAESPTQNQKERFVAGNGGILSTLSIPRSAQKYRVIVRNKNSYVYLNALYLYWSTQGNSASIKVYKRRDADGVWVEHTSDTSSKSAWPGHIYLPFNTIPWSMTTGNAAHYQDVCIEFTPTWSHASNLILLYGMQLWGGYPAGRRTIYDWDEFQNVTFPAGVSASSFTEGGTALASKYAALSHTHSYLPLSGGTLTGATSVAWASASPFTVERTGSNANVAIAIKHTTATAYLGLDSSGVLKVGSTADLTAAGTAISLDGHTHNYAASSHTHGTADITNLSSYTGLDARYYTESEVNSLLSGKANTSHSHSGSDITSGTISSDRLPAYFTADAQAQDDIVARVSSGFYETSTGTTAEGWPITTDGWQHLIACTHSNDGNYYSMQFAGSFFDQNVYLRKTNNSGSTGWSLIWTSGNDGSGSGLDADLLDGQHASAFAAASHTHDYAASSHTHSYLPLSGGTLTGSLTLSNGYLFGYNSYEAIRMADSWLRLNQNGSFTSGVYTPGVFRTDGLLYMNSDTYLQRIAGQRISIGSSTNEIMTRNFSASSAKWTRGTAAPSGGSDGDFYVQYT